MNKLSVRQSFGINSNVNNCVSFSDDHQIVYISGNQLVALNTDTKEQSFISLGNIVNGVNSCTYGVTAIACCLIKKIIAIAESTDVTAIVTFYDSHTLKKKKVIHSNELGSKSIVSMSFSDDGRHLVVQGAGPEWNLLLWNVEKTPKIIGSIKASSSDDSPVYQVSICPWDYTTMIAVGKNIFKVFKIVEGFLRPQPLPLRRENVHISTHCWLQGDRLLLGTDVGELILFESLEYRAVIYPASISQSNDSSSSSTTDATITCIIPSSRGFITGGENGELKLFERKDDSRDYYVKEDICHLPGKHCGAIVAMAIGPDDTFICATNTQQIHSAVLNNLFNNKNDTTMTSIFEPVLTPFHGPNPATGEASILGIDVALWKRVIVTCGKDFSVRVWNPTDRKVELTKYYEEIPFSVSIHPSGLHMAISFTDKIKLVSVLLDDLTPYGEISVRSCNYLKFSHGGQYLAAIVGPTIHIYDAFTTATLCTLRGHTNKIKSIVWMSFDNTIMSVGVDGIVHYWNLFSLTSKRPEQYNHSVPFLCGSTLQDGSRAFVVTTEKILKEFSFTKSIDPITGIEGKIREPHDVPVNRMVSHVIVNESRNMAILAATEGDGTPFNFDHNSQLGSLLCFSIHPQLSMNFDVYPIHASPITAVCLSHDGSTIITGDANGCLIITDFITDDINSNASQSINAAAQVSNAIPSNGLNAGGLLTSFEFVDEVLIKKSDLDQKKDQIAQFSSRVNELNLNNEFQLRLKEMDHQAAVKDLSNKFRFQYQAENEKYEILFREKKDSESILKGKLTKLLAKHVKETNDIEVKYHAKIEAENNRYKVLGKEVEEMHRQWNEENKLLVESHEKYILELTEEYEDKLNAEQLQQKKMLEDKEGLLVVHSDVKNKTELDAEMEIEELKTRYENRLKNEEEASKELKDQHTLLHREIISLTKDSELYKEEIRKLKEKESRLLENIKSLEKDIQGHKKEIREREDTITDKEKRIFDLKKKNQELEKFRFVLDYKIKELKLQIAPREKEIAMMQKQIEEMGLELEQYHKSNQALNLMIEELKLKIDGLRKEYANHDERNELNIRLLEKVKRDLQELSLHITDPRQLKIYMVKIYRIYLQDDLLSANAQDKKGSADNKTKITDPQETYNRDREQMERSLDALRRAVKTDARARKRDFAKMVRDNVVLTRELNDLRKEGSTLQLQKRLIEHAQSAGKLGSTDDIADLLFKLGIKIRRPRSSKQSSLGQPLLSREESTSNYSSTASLSKIFGNPANATSFGMANKKRSSALRTTSTDGRVQTNRMISSVNHADNYEAWCVINNQQLQIKELENEVKELCEELKKDSLDIFSEIDEAIEQDNTMPVMNHKVKIQAW